MEELTSTRRPANRSAVSRRGFVGLGAAATAGIGVAAVGLGATGVFSAAQDASPVASPHDDHATPPAATAGGTPVPIPGPAFVHGQDLVQPEVRASSDGLLETTLQAWVRSVPLAGQA